MCITDSLLVFAYCPLFYAYHTSPEEHKFSFLPNNLFERIGHIAAAYTLSIGPVIPELKYVR
jgi:hypothetical protein